MRDLALKVKSIDADWFDRELTLAEFSFTRHNLKRTTHFIVTYSGDNTERIVNWFIEAHKRRDGEVTL